MNTSLIFRKSSIFLIGVLYILLFIGTRLAGAVTHNVALVNLLPRVTGTTPIVASELMGLQYRSLHDLPPAQFQQLDALDKQLPTGGAILALLGQAAAAETWLRRPGADTPMRHFWLASVVAQQGKPEALTILGGASGVERMLSLAGFAAQQAGDWEKASQLLAAAVQLNDDLIQDRSLVYEYLAKNAYNHAHDWDQSFYWAERWIQSVPNDTYAYTWLAGLHIWQGQPEAAFSVLQRGQLHGVEQNPYFSGQIGQIYQARGQWQLAIENYRKSWDLHKDVTWMRPHVAWSLGFALYHEGQWAEARGYLEIAAQQGVQSAADVLTQMEARNSK